MNKTTLGTILGAALLGLAKSRSVGSSIRLKAETIAELDFEIILSFEYTGEDTDDEFERFIHDLKGVLNTYQLGLGPGEKVEIKFKNILWDSMQPYSLPGQTKLPFDVKLIGLYAPVDEDGDEIDVQDYEEYVNNSADFDDFIYNREEEAKDFLLDTVERYAKNNDVDFKDISIDSSEQEYVSLAKCIVNADTYEVYKKPESSLPKLRKR